jgi:hypothetical protein
MKTRFSVLQCFHLSNHLTDDIPAELNQAGGEILRSKIHKLINSSWNKEELPDQWKESFIVRI